MASTAWKDVVGGIRLQMPDGSRGKAGGSPIVHQSHSFNAK